MSSTLESVVSDILDNNYVTIVLVTAIGYDYILTFSDEIEYVWNKPWTWVSTLFVLIRYFGLCGVMIFSFSAVLFIFAGWCINIFIAAADLAMILRVWALYGRSRIILGILLTLYAMEIISFLVPSIAISIPNHLIMATAQVLDFSFCVSGNGSPISAVVNDSFQFLLASVMCLLVTVQFIRQSFQMYRTTKSWQLSRYVNLFAREGVLYFFAIVLYTLVNLLNYIAYIPTTGMQGLSTAFLEYVPAFTLTPRFILSMRALYARDLRGRCGSRDIDTQFGFMSVSGRGVGGTAMVFAARGQNEEEGLEEDDGIPMGERTQCAGSVA